MLITIVLPCLASKLIVWGQTTEMHKSSWYFHSRNTFFTLHIYQLSRTVCRIQLPQTYTVVWLRLKCDGTRPETRFRLSGKRTSPFKSAGASVQSTTGSRGVRISGSNAGYTKFRSNVKGFGYLLHSPVSPSLPLPCVTVCHHVSTGLY